MNRLDLDTWEQLEAENKRLKKVVRMVLNECKEMGGARDCNNPIHAAARAAINPKPNRK